MTSLSCIRAKANANYICQECGSTELIQAHHLIPDDDDSLIVLCAECHSSKHPDVPRALFFSNGIQPYWYNKSAASLAKAFGVHSRTIIRNAKKLGILSGELSPWDEELIKNSIKKLNKGHKPDKGHKPVQIKYSMICGICGNNWLAKSPEPKRCPVCNKPVKEKVRKNVEIFKIFMRSYFCNACAINWISCEEIHECPLGHNINIEKKS